MGSEQSQRGQPRTELDARATPRTAIAPLAAVERPADASEKPSLLLWIPPPLWFCLAFAAGAWLQPLLPVRIPAYTGLESLGTLLANGGLLLALWCIGLFAITRTTLMPSCSSSGLVTAGPYRFSRNPMYMAVALAYLGLALLHHQHVSALLLPLPLLLLDRMVIPFEERRLARLFGDAYAGYCARVGRWL